MADCNFRRIPEPSSLEDEMSAEPYWSVGPNDVFPEQFERYLVAEPHMRETFLEYHRDLTQPEFWLDKQVRLRGGELEDVFPYPQEVRFKRAALRAEPARRAP